MCNTEELLRNSLLNVKVNLISNLFLYFLYVVCGKLFKKVGKLIYINLMIIQNPPLLRKFLLNRIRFISNISRFGHVATQAFAQQL